MQIRVLPEVAGQPQALRDYLIQKEELNPEDLRHVEIQRKSVDARSRQAYMNLKVCLYINEEYEPCE